MLLISRALATIYWNYLKTLSWAQSAYKDDLLLVEHWRPGECSPGDGCDSLTAYKDELLLVARGRTSGDRPESGRGLRLGADPAKAALGSNAMLRSGCNMEDVAQ